MNRDHDDVRERISDRFDPQETRVALVSFIGRLGRRLRWFSRVGQSTFVIGAPPNFTLSVAGRATNGRELCDVGIHVLHARICQHDWGTC